MRRQLELQESIRLRDLDNLKTRLYTNITHEFRTPLTIIMGMNDNIKGFDQERNLIKRNTKNLLRLINQLLDLHFSRRIHLPVTVCFAGKTRWLLMKRKGIALNPQSFSLTPSPPLGGTFAGPFKNSR